MANPQKAQDAVALFEKKLQATRKERNEKLAQEMLGHDPKKLAQQMLGKERRGGVKSPGPAASLASRVGVTKRSNSLPRLERPRLHAAATVVPPRGPRQPSALHRSVTDDALVTRTKPRPNRANAPAVANSGSGLSIRGAAGGPYILRAQNFAPGTTAADIESVMQTEGQVTYCTLVAAQPTVIAEIGFVEKASADRIIEKFNNKRADGRLLYVYYAETGGAIQKDAVVEEEEQPGAEFVEEAMEVDENSDARYAQDRLREERRGRDARDTREAFQQKPADERYEDQYYRGGRQPEYEDGRYGFAGYRGPPAGRGFGNGGRGGRFPDRGGDRFGGGYRRGQGQGYRS